MSPEELLRAILIGWAFIVVSVPIVAYRGAVKRMPDIVHALGIKRLLTAYLVCLLAIGVVAVCLGLYKFTYDPPIGESAQTTTFPIFTGGYFVLLSGCIVPLMGMLYLPLNLFLIKAGWNTIAVLTALPAAIATTVAAMLGVHDPAVFLPAWLLVFLPLAFVLLSLSLPLGVFWTIGRRRADAA